MRLRVTRRPAVRVAVLAVCGLFVTLAALGCSARTASTPYGTVQECTRYAVYAIQRHITVTRNPPQCAGLTPIAVNEAVESAIQQESGDGPKPERRQRAGEAVRWVSALLSAKRRYWCRWRGWARDWSRSGFRSAIHQRPGSTGTCEWLSTWFATPS